MKLKKGQLLKVDHCRKGSFLVTVKEDCDSNKDTWLSAVIADEQKNKIYGISYNMNWESGDDITVRLSLMTFEVIKKE